MLANEQHDARNHQDAQQKIHAEITRTVHEPKGLSLMLSAELARSLRTIRN